jgi:hypothetical protein
MFIANAYEHVLPLSTYSQSDVRNFEKSGVTGLGEFAPIGQLLSLGIFLKITEVHS